MLSKQSTPALKEALLAISQRSESAASALQFATRSLLLDDAELILQVVADLQRQADQLRALSQSLH